MLFTNPRQHFLLTHPLPKLGGKDVRKGSETTQALSGGLAEQHGGASSRSVALSVVVVAVRRARQILLVSERRREGSGDRAAP
jgi:hypothetical protein